MQQSLLLSPQMPCGSPDAEQYMLVLIRAHLAAAKHPVFWVTILGQAVTRCTISVGSTMHYHNTKH